MYPKDEHNSGNQIPFSSRFNDRFTIDAIITIASMIIWHEYLTKDFHTSYPCVSFAALHVNDAFW